MSAFFMTKKHHIPALLWAGMILLIIGIPGSYIPKPHKFLEIISPDKIIHLIMFGPLSFLTARGIWRQHQNLKSAVLSSLSLGIIYAITTELLQFFVIPGRNGNIYDALADCIGVLIGVYVFYKTRGNKV